MRSLYDAAPLNFHGRHFERALASPILLITNAPRYARWAAVIPASSDADPRGALNASQRRLLSGRADTARSAAASSLQSHMRSVSAMAVLVPPEEEDCVEREEQILEPKIPPIIWSPSAPMEQEESRQLLMLLLVLLLSPFLSDDSSSSAAAVGGGGPGIDSFDIFISSSSISTPKIFFFSKTIPALFFSLFDSLLMWW